MTDERDDPQLINACLAGDSEAWAELVERYQRLVYSVAMRHGLSPEDADDAFQAVFMILLDKLDTCRNQDRLGSWLTTITRREAWRIARQRGARVYAPGDSALEGLTPSEPPPDSMIEKMEEQQLIRQAMGRLGERCRRLLWHLFYAPEHLSYADIAEQLAMPEGSIGPTRARCLKRLRRILRSMGFH
jgi:RNA polymerase sigma factor (sigma-70 family)